MSWTVAGCARAGVAPDGAAARVGCDGDAGGDDREDRVEVAVQHDQLVGPDPAGPPPGRSAPDRSAAGRSAAAWPEPDRAASDRPELTGDAAVDEVLRRVRGPRAPSPGAAGPGAGPDGPAPEGAGPDGAGPDGAGAGLAVRHDELAAAHRDLRALLAAEPPDVPESGRGRQTSPPTADLPPVPATQPVQPTPPPLTPGVAPGTAGPGAAHLDLQVGGPDR